MVDIQESIYKLLICDCEPVFTISVRLQLRTYPIPGLDSKEW